MGMYGQGNILGVWGWMDWVIFGGVGVDGLRQFFLYDLGEIAFGRLDLKLLHLNHTLLTQSSFW